MVLIIIFILEVETRPTHGQNESFVCEEAARFLGELDGAIFKIDTILLEELQTKRLDNFSNVFIIF